MFLVDTNVISELRKARRAAPEVVEWMRATPSAALFISVITLFELERGTLLVERRDPAQGGMLRGWLTGQVEPAFKDRTLVIDATIARCCASLHVPNPRPERDALIAASALVHGLTVVTRNTSDFEPMGVALCNPWNQQ